MQFPPIQYVIFKRQLKHYKVNNCRVDFAKLLSYPERFNGVITANVDRLWLQNV